MSHTGIVHSQLGILWNRRDVAAEMKVRCLAAHKEREPVFVVGGGVLMPFGFHYINKEVRQSSVA